MKPPDENIQMETLDKNMQEKPPNKNTQMKSTKKTYRSIL